MRFAALTDNLALKLFSLLVAALLFLIINFESGAPVEVEYPVEYKVDPTMMITSDAADSIRVTLSGPLARFRTYEEKDLPPIKIDLTANAPEPVNYPIPESAIDPPTGMTVVSWAPSQVSLVLDNRVERLVPVEEFVATDKRPPFGYTFEISFEPSVVRVVGPAKYMEEHLDMSVKTEALDLSSATEDTSFTAALRRPSHLPLLRFVDRQEVTVNVSVKEEMMKIKLADVQVGVVGGPEDGEVQLKPSTVSVELEGPMRILNELDKETLQVVVDVSTEMEEGPLVFDKPVEIRPGLPDQTEIVGNTPLVRVRLPRGKGRKG